MDPLDGWRRWSQDLKTTDLYFERDYGQFISTLPEPTLEALGQFYRSAERDRHYPLLVAWLDRVKASPMSGDEKSIRNLALLFGHLGTRGYAPFTSQAFRDLPRALPDWSKLPSDLRFLSEPAEVCDKLVSVAEAAGDDTSLEVGPDEMRAFERAAEGIRQIGFERVKSWWGEMGLFEHMEASLLWGLVSVLDGLGLRYY